MGKTTIGWTDNSWSPLRVKVKPDAAAIAEAKGYTSLIQIATKMAGHVGPHCEHVSGGCKHCYSGSNNKRCLTANGTGLPFDRRARDLVDTYVDDKILMQPLGWRFAKRVFVENQSDLFGDWIPDAHIDRVFAIAGMCDGQSSWFWAKGCRVAGRHKMQILTKRPERMADYIKSRSTYWGARHFIHMPGFDLKAEWVVRGIERAWLGVSVEDEPTAKDRIPKLLAIRAAVHFVSYEPALGPVDFAPYLQTTRLPALDWLIAGWESGTGARPAKEEWMRDAKDACVKYERAFFYKQSATPKGKKIALPLLDGKRWHQFPRVEDVA